jgi:PAS domain S-box-containing protein
MSDSTSSSTPEGRRPFRWQALLQRATEPLFVIDRRRRLLFVNAAWERQTGLSAQRAHGLVCRRPQPVSPDSSHEDRLAHLLTPPRDAVEGRFCRVRRLLVRAPGSVPATPEWCDVEFFPVRQGSEPPGVLVIGRILPVPSASQPSLALLPERLETLRQRRWADINPQCLHSQVPAVRRLAEQARLAAAVKTCVLICGERGVGKHTLARLIHALSPRRDAYFLCLDARRLPAQAIRAILQDDRTGPLWSGLGTLYLAGLECLDTDIQRSLCEFLTAADQGNRPRLLLSTAAAPEKLLESGKLLPDLYWQASTLTLVVPPLRERLADLPWLIERLSQRRGDTAPLALLSQSAWDILCSYSWPGNLTELRRVLREAGRHNPERIDAEHLPLELRIMHQRELEVRGANRPIPLEATLEEVERRLIRLALVRSGGNRSRAAELLGIHRPRLLRRLEALGLTDVVEEE